MTYLRDRKTGIGYQTGNCNLLHRGFKEVAKLKNIQGLWIRFYANHRTGEVAISTDCTIDSDLVFKTEEDGNKWFERYIKPYHGSKFVRCEV